MADRPDDIVPITPDARFAAPRHCEEAARPTWQSRTLERLTWMRLPRSLRSLAKTNGKVFSVYD